MTLLTKEEFTEHFDTDLSQDAIDRLLNDAESEINRRFGSLTSQIEDHQDEGRYLFLQRPASSITSIVETVGTTDTTLETDDYALYHGNRMIKRLTTGINGRTNWGDRIRVTYVPASDSNQRKRVQLDLVKLAIQYQGLSTQESGNYSANFLDYEKEREKILSRLQSKLGVVA